jgi:hypothetical protein
VFRGRTFINDRSLPTIAMLGNLSPGSSISQAQANSVRLQGLGATYPSSSENALFTFLHTARPPLVDCPSRVHDSTRCFRCNDSHPGDRLPVTKSDAGAGRGSTTRTVRRSLVRREFEFFKCSLHQKG